MIEITYDMANNSVRILGHSGAGKKGADVVCAGVSALAQTLAANVRHWQDSGKLQKEATISLSDGEGLISWEPKHDYEAATRQIAVAICAGFELIAVELPQYVSFRIGCLRNVSETK